MASLILGPIRNAYVDLHLSAPMRFLPSTGDQDDLLLSPSYPLCNVTSHIHDDSASASFTCTNLHDSSALILASLANPSTPSSSVPPPPHAAKSFDVPPLEDTYVPGLIHVHQMTIEDARIPVTLDSPTTRVIHNSTNTSTGTIPLSVPDILTSTLSASKAWIRPTGVADVPHSENCRTSSDAPDAPSSPSPVPVLDDAFPTESQSSAASPDQSRPRLSSAPTLSPVIEGESGAGATLHKGKDAFHPPPIFEEIMATSDPAPEPTTGVTIAGPLQRSLDAGYTGGDHPPNHSRGQYDIS
ncbi:hypothetical protein EDB89DRAFT_2010826 [Lactarius sanguifluus]|nr:hypothetical protein EDB89DRAFT_2010826 [Lactarius sanguifluus]